MNEGKEELDELREAVREFLAAKSSESAVRAAMDAGYDPAVWDQMARQLRLPGLALPSDYGGDGFGLTELEVVLEEMGAALLCSPFFATVVLAAQALLASADQAACARYLPGIAAGQTIATLAAAEGNASWDPAMVSARAERTGDHWALSGTKSFVIDGAIADLVLVVARSTAGPGLFAVDRGAPGLRAEPMTTLDPTRAMAALTFDQVPAVLIGSEGQAGRLMNRVLDLACVALAAEQAGGARRCL
ncbi:MAG TPA: acyl-CoA dehydrogenase family protein, partial [Streptosporangiaceae bacterium]|nr:acyl-CoA dehydrogenase family protein [Streptosporangiaceae bacterium]